MTKPRVVFIGGSRWNVCQEMHDRFEVVRHVEQDERTIPNTLPQNVDYIFVLRNWCSHGIEKGVRNRLTGVPVIHLNKGWPHQKAELQRRGLIEPDAVSVPAAPPPEAEASRETGRAPEPVEEPLPTPEFPDCEIPTAYRAIQGLPMGPYKTERVLIRRMRGFTEFELLPTKDALAYIAGAVECGAVIESGNWIFVHHDPAVRLTPVDEGGVLSRTLPAPAPKASEPELPLLPLNGDDMKKLGVAMSKFASEKGEGFKLGIINGFRMFWDEEAGQVVMWFDEGWARDFIDFIKTPASRRILEKWCHGVLSKKVRVRVEAARPVLFPPSKRTYRARIVDTEVSPLGVVVTMTLEDPDLDERLREISIMFPRKEGGTGGLTEFVKAAFGGRVIHNFDARMLEGRLVKILGRFEHDADIGRTITDPEFLPVVNLIGHREQGHVGA